MAEQLSQYVTREEVARQNSFTPPARYAPCRRRCGRWTLKLQQICLTCGGMQRPTDSTYWPSPDWVMPEARPEDVRVGDQIVDSNGQVGTVKEIQVDCWLMDDGFSLGFVAFQRGARMLPRTPVEPYEPPRTELVANLKDKVAEIQPPAGAGQYDPGTSFHVGIDLADGPSQAIISVVNGSVVLAYARLDVVEEVKELDAYLTNFYPNAVHVLDREVRRLVRSLRTGPVPPIEPAAKAQAQDWTPEWDRFDFLKP